MSMLKTSSWPTARSSGRPRFLDGAARHLKADPKAIAPWRISSRDAGAEHHLRCPDEKSHTHRRGRLRDSILVQTTTRYCSRTKARRKRSRNWSELAEDAKLKSWFNRSERAISRNEEDFGQTITRKLA